MASLAVTGQSESWETCVAQTHKMVVAITDSMAVEGPPGPPDLEVLTRLVFYSHTSRHSRWIRHFRCQPPIILRWLLWMGTHTAVVYASGPPELVVKHKTHMKIIQTGEEDDNNSNNITKALQTSTSI